MHIQNARDVVLLNTPGLCGFLQILDRAIIAKESMHLFTLPTELLLAIAGDLETPRDLLHFVLTNRFLSHILTELLYDLACGAPKAQIALCYAAVYGNRALIRRLLEKADPGAAIEIRGPTTDENADSDLRKAFYYFRTNWTRVIHSAPSEASEEVIDFVCEQGARLMLPNGTALHCAIDLGHLKLAQLLLEKGASHILMDERGGTSLHRMARVLDMEMLELLLLDVMVGKLMLERACEEGDEQEALRQLERGIGFNVRDNRERSTAFDVLGYHAVDVVRLLLKTETDVVKQGSDRPADASGHQDPSQMIRKCSRECCKIFLVVERVRKRMPSSGNNRRWGSWKYV